MAGEPRMTTAVARVLAAMLADPAVPRYGLDLMQDTGLASGTLYPILLRLERAGWVASQWEEIDPVAEGRPSRRYYHLTPEGTAGARRELALLHQQLARATGVVGRAREA